MRKKKGRKSVPPNTIPVSVLYRTQKEHIANCIFGCFAMYLHVLSVQERKVIWLFYITSTQEKQRTTSFYNIIVKFHGFSKHMDSQTILWQVEKIVPGKPSNDYSIESLL